MRVQRMAMLSPYGCGRLDPAAVLPDEIDQPIDGLHLRQVLRDLFPLSRTPRLRR
jgi:hypothetical protein